MKKIFLSTSIFFFLIFLTLSVFAPTIQGQAIYTCGNCGCGNSRKCDRDCSDPNRACWCDPPCPGASGCCSSVAQCSDTNTACGTCPAGKTCEATCGGSAACSPQGGCYYDCVSSTGPTNTPVPTVPPPPTPTTAPACGSTATTTTLFLAVKPPLVACSAVAAYQSTPLTIDKAYSTTVCAMQQNSASLGSPMEIRNTSNNTLIVSPALHNTAYEYNISSLAPSSYNIRASRACDPTYANTFDDNGLYVTDSNFGQWCRAGGAPPVGTVTSCLLRLFSAASCGGGVLGYGQCTPFGVCSSNGTGVCVELGTFSTLTFYSGDVCQPSTCTWTSSNNNCGCGPNPYPASCSWQFGGSLTDSTVSTTSQFLEWRLGGCITPTPISPTPTASSTPTPGPWIKLKNASFSRPQTTDLKSLIPAVISAFDADDFNITSGDTPQSNFIINAPNATYPADPPGGYTNINESGIVTVNGSIDLGTVLGTKISNSNVKIISYPFTKAFDPTAFLAYVRSRKSFRQINSLADIPSTAQPAIYYLNSSTTLTNFPTSTNTPLVLIIQGDLTISANFNTTVPFKSVAIMVTGNINIASAVTEIDGIFIGNRVDFASDASEAIPSSNKLKIRGNAISYNFSSLLKRKSADLSKPSMFVYFDPKMYLDTFTLLSTSTYEWKQLQ